MANGVATIIGNWIVDDQSEQVVQDSNSRIEKKRGDIEQVVQHNGGLIEELKQSKQEETS